MTHLAFLFVIAMCASATLSVTAQQECGPELPPCDEPHGEPGCLQPGCCEIVCETDAFCCEVSWDETCVEQAVDLCGDIACPNLGECLAVHDTPGCLDEACCELVRLHDPFCGYGTWDSICVAEAAGWCGATLECPIEPPLDAIPEGEPCLDRINDGCSQNAIEAVSSILHCGDKIYGKTTTTVPRDVDWYRLPSTTDGIWTATLSTEFPARLLLVTGDCEGPIRTVDEHHVDPCTSDDWSFVLPEGEWYLVVEAGVSDRPLRSGLPCDEIDPKNPPGDDDEPLPREYGLHYLLQVDCNAVDCEADLNGDGTIDGQDLGLLFVAWGACPDACPADLDGNAVVDGQDLGLLFVAWGSCP